MAVACAPVAEGDAGPGGSDAGAGTDAGHHTVDAGEQDAGEHDAGDQDVDAGHHDAGNSGADGGHDDDAGAGGQDAGPFSHPSSTSVAEVIHESSPLGLAAYMQDGSTLPLVEGPDAFGVSNDGALLAYGDYDGNAWVKSTSGGQPTLVFSGGDGSGFGFEDVVFSPDNSKIAIRYNSEVYVAATDGSGSTDALGGFTSKFFSPDGSYILLGNPSQSNVYPGYVQVEIVSTATGAITASVGGIIGEPQWTPDSSAMYALESTGEPVCSLQVLRVVSADGTETTPIACAKGGAKLAPDGSKIAYAKAKSIGSSAWNLYVTDAVGANEVAVASTGRDPQYYAWLPDSAGLVYFDATVDAPAVRRVNADGSSELQLELLTAASVMHDPSLVISPDGATVAYGTIADGFVQELHMADTSTADSGVAVLPDDDHSGFFNLRWSADNGCLGVIRKDADDKSRAFVVGRAGACAALETDTWRGPVPDGFNPVHSSGGVGFAGGAVVSGVYRQIVRESGGEATNLLPEDTWSLRDIIAIDRYVGSGSDAAPERVSVQVLSGTN